MKLAFTENNPEMGIVGLKKVKFIGAILDNREEDLWIARLLSTSGIFVGYFCMFSTDDCEYHLQNDKGSVRIFKTVESASVFYGDIKEVCLTHVNLGLV